MKHRETKLKHGVEHVRYESRTHAPFPVWGEGGVERACMCVQHRRDREPVVLSARCPPKGSN